MIKSMNLNIFSRLGNFFQEYIQIQNFALLQIFIGALDGWVAVRKTDDVNKFKEFSDFQKQPITHFLCTVR